MAGTKKTPPKVMPTGPQTKTPKKTTPPKPAPKRGGVAK